MPVFSLNDDHKFPDPNLAGKDGLLAVGGDLSTGRLISAYSQGIFPWYSEIDPVLWWSPDPRLVLFPGNFKVSKSFQQILRNKPFTVEFDKAFVDVIQACSQVYRTGQQGTWITNDIKEAYINLYRLGYAHSVETYIDGKLAGGLYGVSLGKSFFGESMFYYQKDASKIALYFLVQKLIEWDFHFIDAQVETYHMKSLGAVSVSRKKYLALLKQALNYPTIKGKW